MKSLFLKIFLSFWVAQALFLVIALLVMLALRPQRNATWEALRTTALTEAISAYEQGGTSASPRVPGKPADDAACARLCVR